ncbi:MAG: hypothetical protein V7K64_00230 [Nostoc sp.]|nr:hypothetical protein [Nostoc sp. JL34]
MSSTQQQVTSTDSYKYLLFLPDGLRSSRGDRKVNSRRFESL